ncbi:MAG: XRE family transcriptional regulator [Gemmatimonadota bacterium]|nr:XRE family transcriptional regulator [Gemmatimonadota bacterium]
MTSSKDVESHTSSSNIFLDIGFLPEQAATLLIRSNLTKDLQQLLRERRYSPARAAKILGVSQRRVNDVLRSRIDRLSIDALVKMLGRLGVEFELSFGPAAQVG